MLPNCSQPSDVCCQTVQNHLMYGQTVQSFTCSQTAPRHLTSCHLSKVYCRTVTVITGLLPNCPLLFGGCCQTVHCHLMYCQLFTIIWCMAKVSHVFWCTAKLFTIIWCMAKLSQVIWCTAICHLMYCILSNCHLMYCILPNCPLSSDVLHTAKLSTVIWCTAKLSTVIWHCAKLSAAIQCTTKLCRSSERYNQLSTVIWYTAKMQNTHTTQARHLLLLGRSHCMPQTFVKCSLHSLKYTHTAIVREGWGGGVGGTQNLYRLYYSGLSLCLAKLLCSSAADYTQLVLNTNLLTSTAISNSQVTSVRTVLSRVSHNISK